MILYGTVSLYALRLTRVIQYSTVLDHEFALKSHKIDDAKKTQIYDHPLYCILKEVVLV